MLRTPLSLVEVREKITAGRPLRSAQIFTRAHERGEINLDRIPPPALLAMPFGLMCHDMMTYERISPERVLASVDDLFMPLVAVSRPR